MWRSIYVPEEWQEWISLDLKAQEPRWTAHFAGKMGFPGAEDVIASFNNDASYDIYRGITEITGLGERYGYKKGRDMAKQIFLGLCYAEGGAKVCHGLQLPTRFALTNTASWENHGHYSNKEEALFARRGMPPEIKVLEVAGIEGQAILDSFNQGAPYVRMLARKARSVAERRGYITTVGGRRLHFPQAPDGPFEFTHKALNRLIQGSAADQVKKAMVDLDEQLPDFFMQLQIHDEITGSGEKDVAIEAAGVICKAVPASIPWLVDIEIGPSWGETELLEEVA
jgi:hypothetical protein